MTWTTLNGTARIPLIALLSAALAAFFVVGCQDSTLVEPTADSELEAATQSSANNHAHNGGAVKNFVAPLSGDQEVPPVETKATGVAKFKLSKDGETLSYKLNVANIEDVVASHIHCAPVGENGPVGVTLFSGGPVTINGTLAEGTITEPDAGNGCGWETLDDVIEALKSGDTYVNVHTLAHPPGEIRGQIDRGSGTASLQQELAALRQATSQYQDVKKAEADGYMQESPFVPGMGFHYVKGSLLDGDIEVSEPEALVYDSNDPNQKTRNLVAVEYIIPGPDEETFQESLPTPFTGQGTETWHYEEELGFWTLHVWIWLDNPEGVFHPTNPRVNLGS